MAAARLPRVARGGPGPTLDWFLRRLGRLPRSRSTTGSAFSDPTNGCKAQSRIGEHHMASEIVSQGRAAWGRLKQGSRSWEDWKIVGAALLEGRVVAMRDARAWHPIGRAYSSALDSWLLDNRLNVPLSNRADLFTLMGMLPEVEA